MGVDIRSTFSQIAKSLSKSKLGRAEAAFQHASPKMVREIKPTGGLARPASGCPC